MSQTASYGHAYSMEQQQVKQYPNPNSMSSAFSASANPDEDWTKISDLAERRRIQNRIAQRNYRKKLKKRLEDLERRAGSSSASPEAQPVELAPVETSRKPEANRPANKRSSQRQQADTMGSQYPLHPEDRMFSQQYTRQLSTSPPPFAPLAVPATEGFVSYLSPSLDQPIHSHYLPQQYSHNVDLSVPAIKNEYHTDDQMHQLAMSYAYFDNAGHSYQNYTQYTPPLLDSFDFSTTGSPAESLHQPCTPPSMPHTPLLYR